MSSMLSSRGGHGRGIRTSPRKPFSQSSQQTNRNTVDRAKWTSALTKSLLEACAEEIEDFGRPLNGFNHQAWLRILNAFLGKTGKLWTEDQLKNQHDCLKDDWKAWIIVVLGRDPETGAITGPNHWWANMIAQNKDVAKFKEQGLEHEDLMERVFGDVATMGNNAIFPGDGLSDIESEGSDESDGLRVRGDTISASIAQLIDRFKSQPRIVISRQGRWGIDDAIKKLQSLPFFINEGENDDFYSWACRLFVRQQHKIDIFCEANTVSRTIKWLSDEHALAEEWYWKAPPTQLRGIKPPPFPRGPYH
ncbi:L10-interacting MYB domain-containing protein-like isoform X1 [Rhododendron vialii]|uniref:L10-interacting MYB domain-containing protein-like isoform X1 n=1 Tax=Rhododendron vialii TaxID=182163 RepID=UPI00265FCEE3|nr:L10-interacting MYB domain-containing protein-like isoform X1 [Rhododendron vialii]XP_058202270.1 L10-interacting MYB domain-containing protein-like isoform X1 [Rhododendron vialii]XP_058202271.1 L10-interacting MYB domain-containing protein-like isoform X1 [Rhododendron vialii]